MAEYIVTDSELTSIADAIRVKSGTSGSLAFPNGFIDAIETSTGVSLADLSSGATPIGEVDITGLTFVQSAFAYHPNITSVVGDGYFNAGYIFQGCTGIKSVHVSLTDSVNSNYFTGCTGLETAVLSQPVQGGTAMFNSCTTLEIADLDVYQLRNNYFAYDNNLATIILRRSTDLTRLEGTGVIGSINHFKSGGSGGTIYIPKALYDELGTGSSLDYKAATNWSTINGYGTITWAQIEGSIYETQYADGTPIT